MKISIAMATYNGEEFIKAQLKSFSSQTRLPDELIISDDGSSDTTEEIIRAFSSNAPFPISFSKNVKNLGYCGNFNAALAKTTGDLVFLSDQDDYWHPEKLAHIISVSEKNPSALLFMNDAELSDKTLNPLGITKLQQLLSAGFKESDFVMGCCSALRRELLNLAMPIPENFHAHDLWFSAISEGLGAKIIDNRILQLYRRHENNESLFIANSTQKISKSKALHHKFKKIREANSLGPAKSHIEQLRIFHSGIAHIAKSAPTKYETQLMILQEHSKLKIQHEEKRLIFRRQSFFKRAPKVFLFWLSGGYNTASGFKSMLRDLLG